MGQKVKPISMRLGINRTWDSRWYASKNYGDLLIEDFKIRQLLNKRLPQAGIAKVVIERPNKRCVVSVHAARPGVIIGKAGADIDSVKNAIAKLTGGEVSLNIVEVRKPELDAKLVADSIAQQIERRVSYRRAMKRSMQTTMRLGAKGMRILVSGRLAGAEIAREEQYREGRVPLHTLRADVDYGTAEAKTTYGICGVKVWIFKGEVFGFGHLTQDRPNKNTETRAS